MAAMSISSQRIGKPKKPAPTDWHKADIVAAIWKRGTSLQRLSRQHGYCAGALQLALHRPWPKAERIIAGALGIAPQRLWPSRYHEDGTPKSGRGERGLGRHKAKDSTGGNAVNVHARRAA